MYSKIAASSSNVNLPIPSGYNLANTTATIMDDSLFNSVVANCQKGTSNHWSWSSFNIKASDRYGGQCSPTLDAAESAIRTYFQTDDLDNYNIFKGLFVSRPSSPSLSQNYATVGNSLLVSNATIFGDASIPSPGLLKDTVTLQDGIQQLKTVSTGQKQSVKTASKLASTALKTLATDIKEETQNEFAPALIDYMRQLTANRTLVQMDVDNQIAQSVNETLQDLVNQNDDFTHDYEIGYNDELNRYTDFQSVVSDALAFSKVDTSEILTRMANVTRYIPNYLTRWNATELEMAKILLASTIKDAFTDPLSNAAAGIQNDIGILSYSLADMILSNREDFYTNTTDIASDASNSLNTLANEILSSDKNLVTITDSGSRSTLDASVKSIVAALNTLGLGAYNDALTALNKAKALPASIQAVQSQTDKDVASILAQAQQKDVIKLQATVTYRQGLVRRDFDTKSQSISKNLTDSISAKAATAKAKLQTILGAISASTSGSAGDQTVAGSAAADQAAVGATAAELTAARAKLAGDRASSGLSTVTGVVGAGINDAMNTAGDITNANAAAIAAVQAQTEAAQQALIEQSYNQLNSAAADASGASQSLSASYSGVALAGAGLSDAIEADGQDLYFRLSNQQGTANSALTSAGDLANSAQTKGNSLLGIMSGLENQAPGMVDAALQRIAAIGNGIGAAGQSAQTTATGQAGAQAALVLNQLTGYLGNLNPTGPSSGMVSAQAGLVRDGSSLIKDVNNVPGTVASESALAQALMKARANRAMSQSMAALSATAGDSSAALSSLMQFDADLVDQKRTQVLAGSKNVLDASMDATKYISDAGSNFYNASSQFVYDAQALASAGSLNVTNVLKSLDDTLSDSTMLADRIVATFGGKAANATAAFIAAVQADAVNVVTQIAAKLADAQNATINAGGSLDPIAIQTTANQLNDYVGSLKSAFETQRKAFNTNAQQYSIRRIAAITGLSEAIIAQKATVLAGFANADASEDTVASRTTGALQSLLQAVETAKSQTGSGVSMAQVTQMIGNIGNGTNSLTASLTNQMRSNFAALGNSANGAAANAGTQMGNLAAGAANRAGMLGSSLANAIELVGQSDSAATAAAYDGQKDVFAIAGMLKNFDQATRAKIANMMTAVQSGNMTMNQAMTAARALQQTDITSVYDVVQSLSGYIAQHEAMVETFMSSLNASRDAIATSVTSALTDHEGIQGDIMADIANNTEQLANLHDQLVAVSPVTQTTPLEDSQKQMLQSVTDIEDRVGQVMFGTTTPAPVGPSGLWFNSLTGQTEGGSLTEMARKAALPTDISFPDAINNLHTLLAQASGNLTTDSASFKSEVDNEMLAASNLIQQIVQTVQAAVHV